MLSHKRQAAQLKDDLRQCADSFKNVVDEIIKLIVTEDAKPETYVAPSQPIHQRPLVTIKETAAYLGVNTRSIHQWIADEDFPARHVGRALRFDLVEVDEWTRRRKTIDTRRLTMVR